MEIFKSTSASPAESILVVEDEPSIRDNILWALESEGFPAIAGSTLAEARSALESRPVDLIILDIGLPDGHGLDFCRELRRSSSIPVIFLTARASEIDRVVGLEIGADDYITKPFSPREVTARVRAVLRRVEPFKNSSSTEIENRNLTELRNPLQETAKSSQGEECGFFVDELRCTVLLHGRALELSRYEYRLLKTFVSHPDRVFSRAQLMDHAWEEPEASLERTVDSHIKSLRAKLREIDPQANPIRTHRGLGYSFTP